LGLLLLGLRHGVARAMHEQEPGCARQAGLFHFSSED
jgi:hypothetical protein